LSLLYKWFRAKLSFVFGIISHFQTLDHMSLYNNGNLSSQLKSFQYLNSEKEYMVLFTAEC